MKFDIIESFIFSDGVHFHNNALNNNNYYYNSNNHNYNWTKYVNEAFVCI